MKNKWIYGLFAMFVCTLLLLPSALAGSGLGPPYFWLAPATLSLPDGLPSQDPENSGFGPLQVTVWEEFNGADWDIWMKYSPFDGAPASWLFPVLHPATTLGLDERSPAVSVTRNHGGIIGQEIHVVYKRWNPPPVGVWEIYHTYTNNFGLAWSAPILLSTPGLDAINPACTYTEDHANPLMINGFSIQIVWEEQLAGAVYQIMYDAFVYDPTWVPPRGTIPGGPFIVRTPPPGGTCALPEIASVDERRNWFVYDYPFGIVWQEFDGNPVNLNWNVWYRGGLTRTSPPPVGPLFAGASAMLNPAFPTSDHTDPDISTSQDYLPMALVVTFFYYHITYVRYDPAPFIYALENCYYYGALPVPLVPNFVFPVAGAVHTHLPAGVFPIRIDDPTIASKLTSIPGAVAVFETWFAWADVPGALPQQKIWFRVGTYTPGAVPPFAYTIAAILVPYPPVGGAAENNPELWNRNDALRLNPLLTHLVYDQNPSFGGGGNIEVQYIDP